MPNLSIRGYARHRGVSHTAVQKAIKQGRIHLTADGTIDVDTADQDWSRNTSAVNLPRRTPKPEAASAGPNYAQSRAVRELYLARIAKIEFEERTTKLVSRDEVTTAAFNRARIVRDGLLNIPDRLAAMLAAESDAAVVHHILTTEIRKVLDDLSSDNSSRGL